MGTLIQDFRYGLRVLAKRPGFTIAAVLTLALGIGLNAAIFSLYNAVLLRPLPARDPERLVNLYSVTRGEPGTGIFSYPEYTFYRDRNTSFSSIAAYAVGSCCWARSAPLLSRCMRKWSRQISLISSAPLPRWAAHCLRKKTRLPQRIRWSCLTTIFGKDASPAMRT